MDYYCDSAIVVDMKIDFRNNKWGFLRETKVDAEKAANTAAKKKHDSTKLLYTG